MFDRHEKPQKRGMTAFADVKRAELGRISLLRQSARAVFRKREKHEHETSCVP